jgi:hypothetical protein
MTISLAFLAPNLARGIGVERLRDPPTEWSRQFEALGLASALVRDIRKDDCGKLEGYWLTEIGPLNQVALRPTGLAR